MDIDEATELIGTKLDHKIYYKAFPKLTTPEEVMKTHVKQSTDEFNEKMNNIMKLWDQKIQKLRNEFDLDAVFRKFQKYSLKTEMYKEV